MANPFAELEEAPVQQENPFAKLEGFNAYPDLEPQGALGSFWTGIKAKAIPGITSALGAAGGAALAGPETGFVASLPAGIAGAEAGGALGEKLQEKLFSPESLAREKAQMQLNELAGHGLAQGAGQMLPAFASPAGFEKGLGKAAVSATEQAAKTLGKKAVEGAGHAARAGAVMGGASEGQRQAQEGFDPLGLVTHPAEEAVKFAPVGLIPGFGIGKQVVGDVASQILGGIGKAVPDAAVMTLTSNLYDHFFHDKPLDLSNIKDETGQSIPSFALLNGLMGVIHAPGMMKAISDAKKAEIPAGPSIADEVAAQAQAAKSQLEAKSTEVAATGLAPATADALAKAGQTKHDEIISTAVESAAKEVPPTNEQETVPVEQPSEILDPDAKETTPEISPVLGPESPPSEGGVEGERPVVGQSSASVEVGKETIPVSAGRVQELMDNGMSKEDAMMQAKNEANPLAPQTNAAPEIIEPSRVPVQPEGGIESGQTSETSPSDSLLSPEEGKTEPSGEGLQPQGNEVQTIEPPQPNAPEPIPAGQEVPPNVPAEPQAPKPEGAGQGVEPPNPTGTEPAAAPEIPEGMTSLKQAVMDVETAQEGRTPIPAGESRKWDVSTKQAVEVLKNDPNAGRKLVDSLKTDNRPLKEHEAEVILLHKAARRGEAKALLDEINNPATTPERRALAQRELEDTRKLLQDVDEFYSRHKAGSISETARTLNAQKKWAQEDGSLESLRSRLQAAQDGKPLTDEQEKIAEKTQAESEAARKAADEATAAAAKEQAEQIIKEANEKAAQILKDAIAEAAKQPRAARTSTPQQRKSALQLLAQRIGKTVAEEPPSQPKPPTAKKPRPTKPAEVKTAEDDYAAKRSKVVKDAEDAEREAIAKEDEALKAAQQDTTTEHPEGYVASEDVENPEDAKKNAEVRQPALEDRIKKAGEMAGQEFDETNGDHPGSPPFTPFMDATGLLTAAHVVRTMARQARDIAQFSEKMIRKFGEWIKPHLTQLWDAAKRGADKVHEYLKGIAQAARKTSRQGGTSENPLTKQKDIDIGAFRYGQEAQKNGRVNFASWKTRMEENGFKHPTAELFKNAEKAYHDALDEVSGAPKATSPKDVVESHKGKASTVHEIAHELAKAHGKSDPSLKADNPEDVKEWINRVRTDLKEAGHDLSHSETRAAIVDYRKHEEKKQSEENKNFSEAKSAMLEESKQESAAFGDMPWIRRIFAKTPEFLRVARQKTRDAIRKVIPDEKTLEGRARSEQQRIESTLKNQIADIQRQIDDPEHKEREARDPVKYNETNEALKEKRDALKAHLTDLMEASGIPQEQARLERVKELQASLEKWQKRLETGKSPDKPEQRIDSTEEKVLKGKIEAIQREIHQENKLMEKPKEARDTRAKKISDLQAKLDQWEKHLREGTRPEKSAESDQFDVETSSIKGKIEAIQRELREEDKLRDNGDAKAKADRAKKIAALENSLKEWREHLANGTEPAKNSKIEKDAEERAIQGQIKAIRDEISEQNKLMTAPPTDAEKAQLYNERRQAAARASEDYWKERLARKQFEQRGKPQTPELTKETQDVEDAAKAAKKAFEDAAEASGIPSEHRLVLRVKAMKDRAEELQKHVDAGTLPGKKGESAHPINKSDPRFIAQKDELKRLNKILRDRRVGMAKDAKIAARMLHDVTNKQIIELSAIPKRTPEQDAELADLKKALLDFEASKTAPVPTPDEVALAKLKERLDARESRATATHAKMLATGELPPKKTRRQVQLDKDAREKEAKALLAEQKRDQLIYDTELAAQPWYQKLLRGGTRVKRAAVLMGAPIYLKLAIAGNILRPFMTLMEETMGKGWLKTVMPDVAAGAHGEGGASGIKAMQNYGRGWTEGLLEGKHVEFTGKSRAQVLYGDPEKGTRLTKTKWEEYLTTHPHAVFKAPAWHGAFRMSEGNRIARAGYRSAEQVPEEELLQMRRAAAKDADHAIYRNDNFLNDLYNTQLGAMQRAGTAGKILSEILRFENVIVKVPTNLVGEAAKYVFGAAVAPIRRAILKGKQNGELTPEQYDSLARTFKKGTTFLSLVALAAAVPGAIRLGGQYSGDKRKKGDMEPNEVEIFGEKIPHIATHAGIFSAAQALGSAIRDYQSQMEHKASVPAGTFHALTEGILGLGAQVPMIRGTGEFLTNIGAGHEKEAARSRALKGTIPMPIRFAAEAQDYHGKQSLAHRLFLGPDHDKSATTYRGAGFQTGIPEIPGLPFLPSRKDLPVKKHP